MDPLPLYIGGRFTKGAEPPAEIINPWGWLYFRVCLSSRDSAERLRVRGVFLTYEAIRQ